MHSIVFDFNLLVVSSIAKGKLRELFKVINGEFKLVFSKEILSEFAEIMGREKVPQYGGEK
jgi:predicted nucleic acid-binding protein